MLEVLSSQSVCCLLLCIVPTFVRPRIYLFFIYILLFAKKKKKVWITPTMYYMDSNARVDCRTTHKTFLEGNKLMSLYIIIKTQWYNVFFLFFFVCNICGKINVISYQTVLCVDTTLSRYVVMLLINVLYIMSALFIIIIHAC
jgi:hypothetical protein